MVRHSPEIGTLMRSFQDGCASMSILVIYFDFRAFGATTLVANAGINLPDVPRWGQASVHEDRNLHHG